MTAQVTDLDWRRRGACKDVDPEIFFRESQRGVKIAKAICAGCPVQARCLPWALDQSDDRFGVAAGMTPAERLQLRVAMGKVAV